MLGLLYLDRDNRPVSGRLFSPAALLKGFERRKNKKLSVPHQPVPFCPPLLLLFDNSLEQSLKLISHAFIHYNPGS